MADFTLENRQFKILNPEPPVNAEDIAVFESQIGIQLPPQLRSYYLRSNGGQPRPAEVPPSKSVWIRLYWEGGSEAATRGEFAIIDYLYEINSTPSMDFLRTWNDYKERIPSGYLPFMSDQGGNQFLIGITATNLGRIYYWNRGFNPFDKKNIAFVADCFVDFLLALRDGPNRGESQEEWIKRVYRQ